MHKQVQLILITNVMVLIKTFSYATPLWSSHPTESHCPPSPPMRPFLERCGSPSTTAISEAETAVMLSPAEKCQEPPGAGRGRETSSPRAFGENVALLTPSCQTRENTFLLFQGTEFVATCDGCLRKVIHTHFRGVSESLLLSSDTATRTRLSLLSSKWRSWSSSVRPQADKSSSRSGGIFKWSSHPTVPCGPGSQNSGCGSSIEMK